MTKRKYTKRKTTRQPVKKRKYTRRKTTKKRISVKFLILLVLIIVVSPMIFYTIFIFPKTLQKKINNNLIQIYNPVDSQQKGDFVVLKLHNQPGKKIQTKAFNLIKKNYGLSLKFIKILSSSNRGINKIEFYRNKKKFSGIKNFYIFWDITKDIEPTKKQKLATNAKKEFIKIEEAAKLSKNTTRTTISAIRFKQNNSQETNNFSHFAKVAIIIDDVGYNYNSTYNFLTLGFPITIALIPDAVKSRKFYDLFTRYNYDVILHIPMEPIKGKKYVEKNAILTDMSDQSIKNRVNSFFDEYPLALGANNHMGSKAVSDGRVMRDLLEVLSARGKIWIDSMTSRYTVTKEVSAVLSMHYLERDVFLDNSRDYNSIKNAMDKLVAEAKKKGYAIGIGHIQSPVLATVLKEYYNGRNLLKIRFVSLKEVPEY